MSTANIGIISFSGGEFSPLVDCRNDVEKYLSGCRCLQNFIPTIYGAAVRRPGTKFVYQIVPTPISYYGQGLYGDGIYYG